MLSVGLIMTSLVNIAFGLSGSLSVMCVLWAMNGCFQGFGAPSCAKIITSWFPSNERGTWWSLWNTSHNIGGFIAPLVAGSAARLAGWRWGMIVPGIVGLTAALACSAGVRSSPESIGLPSAEAYGQDDALAEGKERPDGNAAIDATAGIESRRREQTERRGLWRTMREKILSNHSLWCLACSYFFLYIVRQGITSWSAFYLVSAKNTGSAHAAVIFSGFELGGLLGSFVLGKATDGWINASNVDARAGGIGDGHVGYRIQLSIVYIVLLVVSLGALWLAPAVTSMWAHCQVWVTVFMTGFFLYGPQMSVGLCAAELVSPDVVGASQGFLGIVAYIGAANAGVPLARVLDQRGWAGFFLALCSASVLSLACLIPLTRRRSYAQAATAAVDAR